MSLRDRTFANGYPKLAAWNSNAPGLVTRLLLWGAVLMIFVTRPGLARKLLKERSRPANPDNDLYPLW